MSDKYHYSPLLVAVLKKRKILVGMNWSVIMFHFHFPSDSWYWASFSVLIDHSYIFFGEMSGHNTAHFLLDHLSSYWVVRAFVYSGYKSFITYCLQIFSPIMGHLFYFINGIVFIIKVLILTKSILFCYLCFWSCV